MKVAILAGGMGTRLAEETVLRPKPMVEIGGRPILWHIMKHYLRYGHADFAIGLGYKGDYIKRYFIDAAQMAGSLRVDAASSQITPYDKPKADWRVDLIETGEKTNTGGRVRRLRPYLGDSTFMLTWGDGVSDVDLSALLAFHRSHGKLLTVTAVRPPARFGHLVFEGDRIVDFDEKPTAAEGWINGAFFVVEPKVLDYIADDDTSWEHGPMRQLAREGQLMAFKHEGFWQCMDTVRERKLLEDVWAGGKAPWKTWND